MHHRAHPGRGLSSHSSSSSSTPVRSLNVFNPKILDASIRDVTSCLADEQKADVLLSAMAHLQIDRSVVTRLQPRVPYLMFGLLHAACLTYSQCHVFSSATCVADRVVAARERS